MSLKKSEIKKQFAEAIQDDKTDYAFDELMLSMRILSEIERLMEESDMGKNELANLLNVSAPYITMLFRGEKILNLEKIARLQDVFNVDFRIHAEDRETRYGEDIPTLYNMGNEVIFENAAVYSFQHVYSKNQMKIISKSTLEKVVA